MQNNELTKKELDEMFLFLKTISVFNLKWGESVSFVCPLCGGHANAMRSDYNGHHHAWCEQCDAKLDV